MLAIQTENLSKYYGEHLGIKDVTLEVEEGEIYGFIGPNGAGKSTAIRVLLGLLNPTTGSARVFGMDTQAQGHIIRKDIGYLPSEVNYYDEMTSKELLEYHARFYWNVDHQEILRLADYFELDLNKAITDLSFGNKKKCAIIQSLLHKPKLLILDEPTAGLDPLIQNRYFELLEELNQTGVTIFFSSHILSDIQRLCDKAAVIRKGEITAVEDINMLLKKQMKKGRFLFKSKPQDLIEPTGVQKVKWHNAKLTFEYVGPINDLVNWMTTLDLIDAVLEDPDLESIFMNYYER